MKLKSEYLNQGIWIPQINQIVEGRFIPEDLIPFLSKKYPEFFESAVETKINSKKDKNAISFTNSVEHSSDDNNSAE